MEMGKTLAKGTGTNPTSKYTCMRYDTETLSEILCSSVDMLGYCMEMVQYRRDINKRLDEIHNSKPFAVINITTGGKADGSALYFESDIDRLYVVKGITCIMSGPSVESSTVLKIDRHGCSPGYTRLKLMSMKESNSVIRKYLVDEDNEYFVSNRFSLFPDRTYMIDINGTRIHKQNKSGPSSPHGNSSIKYDFVFGFECKCPDLIGNWAEQVRTYNWPDKRLIQYILSLEGHVVPVANKESNYPDTEWRICFTKAEMTLMHSLNEFQFKSYIVLKLIAKSVLKPLCTEMSSYIMKNVVFWVIGTRSKDMFSKESLVDRVVDLLIFLKECISLNLLKSYMIPERNLFEGRINAEERDSLLRKINELLDDKEGMINQCKKLSVAVTKVKETPKQFLEEAEKRNKIEKLVYQKNIIFKETDTPGLGIERFQYSLERNEIYRQYETELHNLVIPDRRDVSSNFEEIFRDRLSSILS